MVPDETSGRGSNGRPPVVGLAQPRETSPANPSHPGDSVPNAGNANDDSGTPHSALRTPHLGSSSSPSSESALCYAQTLANLLDQYIDLTEHQHLTQRAAGHLLGKPASFFSGPDSALARYRRGGLAALAPDRSGGTANACDLTRRLEALGWFVPAAQFFYLNTNLTSERGSVPEAIRRTISLPALPNGWRNDTRTRFLRAVAPYLAPGPARMPLRTPRSALPIPHCPEDLREEILSREKAGRPLVPERIARQILVNPAIVRRLRSPHAWSVDTLSAPGSQRRYYNKDTGSRDIMAPGDWFGGDDSTPGIAVTVPCTHVITPCSQRYGVLLGRFQWLAYNDARCDKILAWDYVVRPRGSYRAEDIVNGMGAVTRTHGIPRRGWQFEGGSWNSNLVKNCIQLLGCEHWRTYSPHQKAIESIFNRCWTRLAVQFPHADMGRFRNENEQNCSLYEACKAGHKDPRKYFPTLDLVTAVFEEEVKAHNAKLIKSVQYGQWIPDDLWAQAVADSPLRRFNAEMDFIFSPFAVERKVHGMMVRCRVPMFENFSVPFEFHADWMPLYNGRLVRLHFNPRAPSPIATLVLLENANDRKAGAILGTAKLIGETASHIRLVMGWAEDDQRAGYIARQRTANFLRRETRAILGKTVHRSSEERDGLGTVTKLESGALSNSAPSTEAAKMDTPTHGGDAPINTPIHGGASDRTVRPTVSTGSDESSLSARERQAEKTESALDYL